MHLDLESLSAHLDGDLPTPDAQRAAAHLGECAACRGWVRELEEMRALTAHRELAPPVPDLWPRIRAELAEAPAVRGAWLRGPSLGTWLRGPRLAWSVAALMAVLALASWLRPAPDPYAPVRASYLAQIARLTPGARAAQARLPERSRQEIVASLEIVDRAIADCERALAGAPGDPFGEEALLALYDEKIRVLNASIASIERGDDR